jgi:magnesium-protoporphyrin O-methyltransferase
MQTASYYTRRDQLQTYFDRTAVEAWRRLNSDEPLGRIRATVRAGRNEMREALAAWLPADLQGATVLDAGCGAGAMATELAARGAKVVAVDVSPTLLALARARAPARLDIDWRVGDMLDPSLGHFDYVVAMDSLIHYSGGDIARALANLARRTASAMLFTVAPSTPLLTVMHALGRCFPRGDRAPAIAPISTERLAQAIRHCEALADWRMARVRRVTRGFYISQAMEALRI